MQTSGRLIFDPLPINGSTSMFKPYWAIVQMNCDIDSYYRWFLERRYNIKLIKPAWGAHISVIRGEPCEQWEYFKSKYNNKIIDFEYNLEFKTNGQHWWLNIVCDELKAIRQEMGYNSNGIGLHLTLGQPIPLHTEFSEYLWNLYKKELLNL